MVNHYILLYGHISLLSLFSFYVYAIPDPAGKKAEFLLFHVGQTAYSQHLILSLSIGYAGCFMRKIEDCILLGLQLCKQKIKYM